MLFSQIENVGYSHESMTQLESNESATWTIQIDVQNAVERQIEPNAKKNDSCLLPQRYNCLFFV